jgi:tetratricopeptide (TPR) repeat protein
MMLLDYWPLKRFESKKGNPFLWQLKEKLPFFILSLALAVFTLYDANKTNEFNKYIQTIPPVSRLANIPVSFFAYLEKTFWPYDMAFFYPFPSRISIWQFAGASFFIITVTTFVLIKAKRLSFLFVGWLWFAITIAPVIGIIQISLTEPYAIADRYHYLPSIGLAVMLAWGVPSLIQSEDLRKKILFPAGIIFIALLSFITLRLCGYWKDSITLYNHTLEVTQDNYLVFNNRGIVYDEQGRNQLAIEDFNKAIKLKPGYANAYYNRGNAYVKTGQYDLAIDDYNKAINHEPDYAEAFNNRAFVYLSIRNLNSGCKDAHKACELGSCNLLKAAKSKGDCR